MSVSEDASIPQFWRDETLPFIEARHVRDGRKLCYARHAHETFSIGSIIAGHSTYINGKRAQCIEAGTVVLMNPEEVHACNPIDDQSWSYTMFYIDQCWMANLQHELGFAAHHNFNPFSTMATTVPQLADGLNDLYTILINADAENLEKHGAVIAYFSKLQQILNPSGKTGTSHASNRKLKHAAEFIDANCQDPLQLEAICAAADISPSYLIRSFKKHYGMTPHAYLINRRIQFARAQLKRGYDIAEVALQAGFADQAHFQRVFKRLVAATPGQYRN